MANVAFQPKIYFNIYLLQAKQVATRSFSSSTINGYVYRAMQEQLPRRINRAQDKHATRSTAAKKISQLYKLFHARLATD